MWLRDPGANGGNSCNADCYAQFYDGQYETKGAQRMAVTTTLHNTNSAGQHIADIAFHTRQLAVSMLSYPMRVERARALVEIVLEDPQISQSTHVERLLASVLVDVHLALGDRAAAVALCNRIDLCSGDDPADALVSARAAAAIALHDLRSTVALDQSMSPINSSMGDDRRNSADQVIEMISRLEVLAADTGGDLLERARAAQLVGRAWALVGKGRPAAAWLASAALLFERSGQPQWSRLMRHEASTIHSAGALNVMSAPPTDGSLVAFRGHRPEGRPHLQSTDNWQVGLTPAERRVALLIGGGRSNREAAAELFVSVKTVESHVQSVFRKLGMHRRSELANLVGRTIAA